MKNILLYLWQLPQNLLGLILLAIWKPEKTLEYKGITVRFNASFPSGISLGNYIVLRQYPANQYRWNCVKHEWGHTRQSLKWGWLYLIVIGLPSLIGNIYDRMAHNGWTYASRQEWYYNQPWEKSADILGGVQR